MGTLVSSLSALLDASLKEKLANASTITLNYTMRLKKEEQWIVQMISDGEIHAIAHKPENLALWSAHRILEDEAKMVRAYLHGRIPGFKAAIVGYYFYGAKEMKYFGRL